MGACWAIWIFVSLATVAFAGAWVEVLLMKVFWRPLFAFGPVLRRLSCNHRRSVRSDEIACAVGGLRRIAAREIPPYVVLGRRSVQLLGTHELPPVWSWRLSLVVVGGDMSEVRLEVRHGVCWSAFLAVPFLGALCEFVAHPSVGGAGFALACLAVLAVPVLVSVRTARGDALRIWQALTRQFIEDHGG